ncbi:MAG: hypothetical protein RLZZ303_3579 [Candidatus Hydrogenedentota bacterium]|jgi:hypothetical protein
MRGYRYALFALSVLIAFALHALFFYLAPQIVLLQQPRASAKEIRPIRIALRPASSAASAAPSSRTLATRPGTVSDLARRDNEELRPDTRIAEPFAPLPSLTERIASDPIAREHDTTPDPEVSKRADARILEIATRDARTQLDIPRRLVRPSPNRLLDPNALPTLRVEGADMPVLGEQVSLGRSILNEAPGPPQEQAAPPAELEAAREAGSAIELPTLELESMPLTSAAEEARKESAYTFLDDLLDIRLDAYVPNPGEPGYFRLRVLPRQDAVLTSVPKEVTFVVDASKSIPQHKLRATTKAIAASLDLLKPEDTMNVVVFRNNNQLLRPAPEAATESLKKEAAALLDGLEAKGETDVFQALQPLMQTAPPTGQPSLILLFSDGRPTIGMRDTRTLINSLTADNNLRNTVYAFAAGNNVNRALLDLLAYRNKGAARVTDDIDRIGEDLPPFLMQLKDPLLVDCRADFSQVNPEGIYPKNLADLYAARPIVLYGRFEPAQTERFVIRITGRAGTTPKEVVFEAAFKDAVSSDASVANGWAFEKAYHIIGEISRQGETPELLAELRGLSAQYGIKTSYD